VLLSLHVNKYELNWVIIIIIIIIIVFISTYKEKFQPFITVDLFSKYCVRYDKLLEKLNLQKLL
jgi:hypothetical protein